MARATGSAGSAGPAGRAGGGGDPARAGDPAFAFAHCEALVRAGDPDRYAATLFAPASARPDLFALYAFSLEVARVREGVSAPMPGEIRLQWWRDALQGEARGDVRAHPVAAALEEAIGRRRLPRAPLVALVEARVFDLYDDPMPSTGDLEGYCGETSSALMRLAALVLADAAGTGNAPEGDPGRDPGRDPGFDPGGAARDPGGAAACGHAGVAYAVTGLLRALPWHARRGQVYLPADVLGAHGVTREDIVTGRGGPGLRGACADLRALARRHLAASERDRAALAAPARPALLPAALVPELLARMERPGYDPLASVVDLPRWRRVWRMWRAA